MKNSLRFIGVIVILSIQGSFFFSDGQVTIISEDFSGFTSGTHSSPSTSDASALLDGKTGSPGWTGSLIYPAGGEIKVGTSSATGWIETPLLNLSAAGGNIVVKFDIARWVSDASTVRVYLNDTEIGDLINPSDNFQTVEINVTGIVSSGKIKIKGLTKRFYLDNLLIKNADIPTGFEETYLSGKSLLIYPVPVHDNLILKSEVMPEEIKIFDVTARIINVISPVAGNQIVINTQLLKDGIYFIRCKYGNQSIIRKFIKSGN